MGSGQDPFGDIDHVPDPAVESAGQNFSGGPRVVVVDPEPKRIEVAPVTQFEKLQFALEVPFDRFQDTCHGPVFNPAICFDHQIIGVDADKRIDGGRPWSCCDGDKTTADVHQWYGKTIQPLKKLAFSKAHG